MSLAPGVLSTILNSSLIFIRSDVGALVFTSQLNMLPAIVIRAL